MNGSAVDIPTPETDALLQATAEPQELSAHARNLERRLIAAEKKLEWQPIETAPKDGTIIQGWYSGGWMPRMRWSVYYKAWEVRNGWEWMQLFTQTPTHWMPLPDAAKT